MAATLTRSPDIILSRIRGEYLEMPGLVLTPAQAQRLWNLDSRLCDRLLKDLVAEGFLACTREGMFLRRDRSPAR